MISTILLCTCVVLCNGFAWKRAVPVDPVELKGVTYIHDEDTIRQMYDEMENHVEPQKREYSLHTMDGENCGSTKLPIIVNSLQLPDVIVLGDNATVAVDATIDREIETASLLQVVVQKVGLPIDIPCLNNIGTCNYTNPCDILKTIDCPPAIEKLGWNCRCPFKPMEFKLLPTTVPLPTVPLPPVLVDGSYNVKVQMFDGKTELFCYKVTITLKEKQ